MGMASPRIASEDSLRDTVDRKVLEPLFRDLEKQVADPSIPEVVFENRRRRARLRLADALASRGSATIPRDLEREVEHLVRRWGRRGFDDGFSAVELFEIDRAQERRVAVALDGKGAVRRQRAAAEALRLRVRRELGRVALPGLQTTDPVLHDLESLYVPLTLERVPNGFTGIDGLENRAAFTVLEEACLSVGDALSRSQRILVVGDPGSGKSTLVAWIATRLASGKGQDVGCPKNPLPLVIPARSWDGRKQLTAATLASFLEIDAATVEEVLRKDRAVLLVDGLDEILPWGRRRFDDSLRALWRKYPELTVVVTTRPTGLSPGPFSCLQELETFRLTELGSAGVRSFVKKWYSAAVSSAQGAFVDAERPARDLIGAIENSFPMQQLVETPLIVSILCWIHYSSGYLPEQRASLYSRCLEVMLSRWDQHGEPGGAKGERLETEQVRKALMGLARMLHEENRSEISWDQIEQELRCYGFGSSQGVSAPGLLLGVSGLLQEKEPGVFTFSDRVFQDYLAALAFVEAGDLRELLRHWEDAQYQEVLVIAAEIARADARILIEGLLEKSSREATLLAVRCTDGATGIPHALRERVQKHLKLLLPPKSQGEAQEFASLGPAVAPSLLELLSDRPSGLVGEDYVWTVYAVARVDYEPAIPILFRLASDATPTPLSLRGPMGCSAEMRYLSVGEFVSWILFWKAGSSPGALRILKKTLARQKNFELLSILREHAPSEQCQEEELGKKRLAVMAELASEGPGGDLPRWPSHNTG